MRMIPDEAEKERAGEHEHGAELGRIDGLCFAAHIGVDIEIKNKYEQ